MADILGSLVGVASLAIELTHILHDYSQDVKGFRADVDRLLADTKLLSEVLGTFEDFLDREATKLSGSFKATSALHNANKRCEASLVSLRDTLQDQRSESRARRVMLAVAWPFKADDTEKISTNIRGYIQVVQFALNVDGCQLLLKTSIEVSQILQSSAVTTAQNTKDMRLLLAILSPIEGHLLDFERRAEVNEKEKVLEWLNPTGVLAEHQAIRRPRLQNTGRWIFDNENYNKWNDGHRPILWAQGKPGAGKSVIISSVIDRLKAEIGPDEGVAFFYSKYSHTPGEQKPEAILSTLSWQLLSRLQYCPPDTHDIYERHRREKTGLDVADSIIILEQMFTHFSRTWLFIDALDELEQESRTSLLGVLESLARSTRIFLTSRPQSVSSDELESRTLHCTIFARDEDMTAVIRDRLDKKPASRQLRKQPAWTIFVDDVIDKLISNANGMFVLVALQLETLFRLRTIVKMREALECVPESLSDFYTLTLKRINAGDSVVAMRILAWLVKCQRSMTAAELREALAIESDNTQINTDAFVYEDDILDICYGLVTIDENGTLSFAHATVHEYLSENLQNACGFDYTIARSCLSYLGLKTLTSRTVDYLTEDGMLNRAEYDARVTDHPFLPYAASCWLHHYCRVQDDKVAVLLSLASELLERGDLPLMLDAFRTTEESHSSSSESSLINQAIELGNVPIAQLLAMHAKKIAPAKDKGSLYLRKDLDCRSGRMVAFYNPLEFALYTKRYEMAILLFETGEVTMGPFANISFNRIERTGNNELIRLSLRNLGEEHFTFAQQICQEEKYKEYLIDKSRANTRLDRLRRWPVRSS